MGIFNSIKNLFASPVTKEESKEKLPAAKDVITTKKLSKTEKTYVSYTKQVKRNKFKREMTLDLHAETQPSWDTFFSVAKTNPKLIGFENRSRKKFKHLFNDSHLLIAQAAGLIEYVTENEIKQVSIKETPLEKMSFVKTNRNGVILNQKEKVAFINSQTHQATLYSFEWQPFSFAMGHGFWLIGTRETYEGPGELYCFDFDGNLKWSMGFKEKFSTMFGELTFMPYILKVSIDSTDIFVASMDRLYCLDVHGNIKARMAVSELKEQEMQQKERELKKKWTREPKTREEAVRMYAEQFASQFTMGMQRMTFNSPFAGFAHDPETDMVFMLEENGRVSAWDQNGRLMWLNTFKNEGRFISWIDGHVVISFKTGETFWINREGTFIYGAQIPKQASTIALIPNQDSYLIVCEDNRLYELHKETGELIKGSEGHPGMELFEMSGRNIFFDGVRNSQGYFWRAHVDHIWNHFKPEMLTKDGNIDTLKSEVAPEITETIPFNKKWELSGPDGWFGNRLINFKYERVYAVIQGERKSFEKRRQLTEKEVQREYNSHYLVCYDFQGKEHWRKHMYSTMWSLFLSPDEEVIFTSVPLNEEITYLPGHLRMISKDGKDIGKFKVPAHGFDLEFESDTLAKIHFAADRDEQPLKGILERDMNGKWNLITYQSGTREDNKLPFGAGLHVLDTHNFSLLRTDKKKYLLKNGTNEIELKLSAAIYEGYETQDNNMLMRIGSRTVHLYDESLERLFEVKQKENIVEVTAGQNSFVVLTKAEAKGYSYKGDLLWKYSGLPKAYETRAEWIPSKEVFVWITGSNTEAIISTVSEEGKVINSQQFGRKLYHRPIIISSEKTCFVLQSNEKIETYNI